MLAKFTHDVVWNTTRGICFELQTKASRLHLWWPRRWSARLPVDCWRTEAVQSGAAFSKSRSASFSAVPVCTIGNFDVDEKGLGEVSNFERIFVPWADIGHFTCVFLRLQSCKTRMPQGHFMLCRNEWLNWPEVEFRGFEWVSSVLDTSPAQLFRVLSGLVMWDGADTEQATHWLSRIIHRLQPTAQRGSVGSHCWFRFPARQACNKTVWQSFNSEVDNTSLLFSHNQLIISE